MRDLVGLLLRRRLHTDVADNADYEVGAGKISRREEGEHVSPIFSDHRWHRLDRVLDISPYRDLVLVLDHVRSRLLLLGRDRCRIGGNHSWRRRRGYGLFYFWWWQ